MPTTYRIPPEDVFSFHYDYFDNATDPVQLGYILGGLVSLKKAVVTTVTSHARLTRNLPPQPSAPVPASAVTPSDSHKIIGGTIEHFAINPDRTVELYLTGGNTLIIPMKS